ncbi:MAG: hypothetical protein LBI62_09195 [Candidatus Accumulibacter sp.]|jgi:hypothetical protein|nr:hypothetical protein [Accumulibacter sp.]
MRRSVRGASLQHPCVLCQSETSGSGIRDQGSGIRDQGSGIRDQGSGIRDQGSGIRDQGSGIRWQDFPRRCVSNCGVQGNHSSAGVFLSGQRPSRFWFSAESAGFAVASANFYAEFRIHAAIGGKPLFPPRPCEDRRPPPRRSAREQSYLLRVVSSQGRKNQNLEGRCPSKLPGRGMIPLHPAIQTYGVFRPPTRANAAAIAFMGGA